jgi:hypothetical protein
VEVHTRARRRAWLGFIGGRLLWLKVPAWYGGASGGARAGTRGGPVGNSRCGRAANAWRGLDFKASWGAYGLGKARGASGRRAGRARTLRWQAPRGTARAGAPDVLAGTTSRCGVIRNPFSSV